MHSASLQVSPMEDVTVKTTWTGLWLDKDIDSDATSTTGILQPDGTSLASPGIDLAGKEKQLGNEIDVEAIYNYTEDVQIGANLGWFLPGDFFKSTNDAVASQAIVHANVNF